MATVTSRNAASAGPSALTRLARGELVTTSPRIGPDSDGDARRRSGCGFSPQVGEYLLDHRPLQDGRDELQFPGAAVRAVLHRQLSLGSTARRRIRPSRTGRCRTPACGRPPVSASGCFVDVKHESRGSTLGQLWRSSKGGSGTRAPDRLLRERHFDRHPRSATDDCPFYEAMPSLKAWITECPVLPLAVVQPRTGHVRVQSGAGAQRRMLGITRGSPQWQTAPPIRCQGHFRTWLFGQRSICFEGDGLPGLCEASNAADRRGKPVLNVFVTDQRGLRDEDM